MPNGWLTAAEAGNADKDRSVLTIDDQATEFLLMGMRLVEGIDLTRYEALAGKPLSQSGLNDLSDMGMVETDGRFLRATKDGRMVLNAVIGRLLEA